MTPTLSWSEVKPSTHPFSYNEHKIVRQLTAVVANNGHEITPWGPAFEAEQARLRLQVEERITEFFVANFGEWSQFWRNDQSYGGVIYNWHGVRSVLTDGYSTAEAEKTAKKALAALARMAVDSREIREAIPNPACRAGRYRVPPQSVA